VERRSSDVAPPRSVWCDPRRLRHPARAVAIRADQSIDFLILLVALVVVDLTATSIRSRRHRGRSFPLKADRRRRRIARDASADLSIMKRSRGFQKRREPSPLAGIPIRLRRREGAACLVRSLRRRRHDLWVASLRAEGFLPRWIDSLLAELPRSSREERFDCSALTPPLLIGTRSARVAVAGPRAIRREFYLFRVSRSRTAAVAYLVSRLRALATDDAAFAAIRAADFVSGANRGQRASTAGRTPCRRRSLQGRFPAGLRR